MTFPKTTYWSAQITFGEDVRTCLPSSQEVLMVQMKNWDPLVSRPELAMAGDQLLTRMIEGQLTENTRTSVLELKVLVGELTGQL